LADNVLTLRSDAVRVLRHGPLEIDVDRLRVKAGNRLVPVAGLQLKLLLHLARHPDWVFTREQLLAELWGTEASHRDPKAVDVVVCRLRRKLGAASAVIESVRLFGYRLRSEKNMR
jgi:DNA-binding response OmpR family regulator